MVYLILVAAFSEGVMFSMGIDDVDFINIKTLFGSTFEIMLKIEKLGVDITELNENMNSILANYDDMEYYYNIGDEENSDTIYNDLYDDLVGLNEYSSELLGQSMTDYQGLKNNVALQSYFISILYMVLLYGIWIMVNKYHYYILKNKYIKVIK